jgi:hypothetical protein
MKQPKGIAEFNLLNHPLVMTHFFDMPEPLYDWQYEVIENICKPRARCAVSTCNEAGKTNVIIPLLGLSIMCAFPGAKVFSTAGAEPQIKEQLWQYLEAKLRPYEKHGWTLVPSDMTVTAPKVEINGHTYRSKWTMRVPKDAKTMEGLHGSWNHGQWTPACIIIDEAKSVSHEIFEAAYRIDPDWFLVISTPGEDSGPFYDAMEEVIKSKREGAHYGSKDELWTYRRKIDWTMCPHLLTPEKLSFRQALIKKHGENSSFIKSFLGGEFWRDTDENYVFTNHDVDLIRKAMSGNAPIKHGEIRAALDFSGGGDEQCIGIINGNDIVCWEQFREQDTAKLARIFVEKLREHKCEPFNCFADSGGIGHAIIDNLESMGYRPIRRYMSNQEPIDKREYADRMTEDHYTFKEKISECKDILRLPNDPLLFKQFRQRKKFQDEHNKVKLEQKPKHRSRTGDSPDRLDTIIFLFSEWEPPKTTVVSQPEREQDWRRQLGKPMPQTGAFGWSSPYKQKSMAEQLVKGRKF